MERHGTQIFNNGNFSFTLGKGNLKFRKSGSVELKANKLSTLTWRWAFIRMAQEAQTTCNIHEKITRGINELASWCMEFEIIHKAPNLHRQAMVVSENVAVSFAWVVGTIRSETGPPAVG
jgi:hypothetical protein